MTNEDKENLQKLMKHRDSCMVALVGAIERQDAQEKAIAQANLTEATRAINMFLNAVSTGDARKFSINEYMKNNRTEKHDWLCKRVECADGFSMSVQAGEYLYSTPRAKVDHYTHVEVGFPSEKPKFFAEYGEQSYDGESDEYYTHYTDTVYGYVPIELVEQEIEAHGGLKLTEREAIIKHANETLFKKDAASGAPGTDGYFSMRD